MIYSAGSDIFLHKNPQYFSFDPPMLRHKVTFNASQVQFRFGQNILLFSCGFMNGDNDRNIFNSTNITVYVQEGMYTCLYLCAYITYVCCMALNFNGQKINVFILSCKL